MVQLMSSRKFSPDSESAAAAAPGRKMGSVKVEVEVEDSLEDQHGPLNKRSKISSCYQGDSGTSASALPPSQYNPLDEPSPLGLRLRKSPSLLDLIQMRLSQGNSAKLENQVKKDPKGSSAGTQDKLKASNFPGSILRIGTWEYISRYEGDLVAKCYFAKHKLVWEVLDGGLKNKIEIQWSDIVALKASYPDNGPGTLDIVLARHPLFFKETNPQPRKHTLWQATSDFTGGQASIHRRHFLQCSQGLLGKHFEKLIQCDPRLSFLSQQQSEIVLDSPYFESKVSDLEDPDDSQRHGFDLNSDDGSSFYGMRGSVSPSGPQLSSMSESQDHTSMPAEHFSAETPSPSSDTGSHVTEEAKGVSHLDHFKVPGLHSSMSMSDLVTHIGHCLSEQITSNNPLLNGEQNKDILEEITQYLLSDTQLASTSDEPSLMSRVNSLCCLLQKDTGESNRIITTPGFETKSKANISEAESKPPPSLPRIDSVGELLLNLPRIASLPKFLFNISEDDDKSSRP